jgi:hypothetical protein
MRPESEDGRAPSGQALAVPVEPASGLAPLGFDPSREDQTIATVMSAVALAFNSDGTRIVTSLDVVNACAALTAFIDAAGQIPPRTLAQWKEDIGNLKIALGPKC